MEMEDRYFKHFLVKRVIFLVLQGAEYKNALDDGKSLKDVQM
jgi:hypothetical protein